MPLLQCPHVAHTPLAMWNLLSHCRWALPLVVTVNSGGKTCRSVVVSGEPRCVGRSFVIKIISYIKSIWDISFKFVMDSLDICIGLSFIQCIAVKCPLCRWKVFSKGFSQGNNPIIYLKGLYLKSSVNQSKLINGKTRSMFCLRF